MGLFAGEQLLKNDHPAVKGERILTQNKKII